MTHTEKIQGIALQVKSRAGNNQAVKIQKSEVSHFVPNPYDKRSRLPKLKIKDLNSIISIDHQKRICVAEPGDRKSVV